MSAREGWAMPKCGRVHHYYVGAEPLCGAGRRLNLYRSPSPSGRRCKRCDRLAEERLPVLVSEPTHCGICETGRLEERDGQVPRHPLFGRICLACADADHETAAQRRERLACGGGLRREVRHG